eukprot:gene21707-21662_t
MLIALALSAPAEPPSAHGLWKTPTGGHIRMAPCGAELCGTVVTSPYLREHPDQKDVLNTNPALRARAIKGARTALVFVNTRFQAEFAFQELWRLNEDNLPIALHHGSLAAEQRRKVEAAMARGDLRAVVCTSTLDLGIDWGDVDLVIQLAAPKGASRMVQRIGRANHRLDEPSKAIFVPANRFEVLECQAAREAIAENAFDAEPARIGALDVLAQHVMGCACSEPFDLLTLYDEVRGAGPYRALSWEDFEAVIEFVSTGGYALKTYERYARIRRTKEGLFRVSNPL